MPPPLGAWAREPAVGRGPREMAVERGIVPRQAMLVDQALEAADERLAQRLGVPLVRGGAVVHAAAERPGRTGGAAAVLVLPGAGRPPVERPDRGRGLVQQRLGL